jgi:hypothetical protein
MAGSVCRFAPSAARQNKNPTAVWQWGFDKSLVSESEPDCRVAQQQRTRKQQIQIAIHALKLAI